MIEKEIKNEDKMYLGTNYNNLDRLSELLNYFLLDNNSYNRCIDRINGKKDQEIDKILNLEYPYYRRIFKISIPEEMNEAYSEYKLLMYHKRDTEGSLLEIFDKIIDKFKLYSEKDHGNKRIELFYTLLNYENFVNNKVILGKNTFTLFKFLKKQKILSQTELDRLNSLKTNNKLYFVISRNPVDFIFCSTGQNFTSCLDLRSDYEGAEYLGLPSTIIDPNRYLVFLTNGKLRRVAIREKEFKVFSITCRSWVLLNDEDKHFVVKAYPNNNHVELLESLIKEAGFEITTEFSESKYEFKPCRLENGNISMIYLDSGIGINYADSEYIYYSKHGEDCDVMKITVNCSFEQLSSIDDLTETMTCYFCGDNISEDSCCYTPDGEACCNYCFHDRYTYCEVCREVYSIEDTYWIEHENRNVCIDCLDNNYTKCDDCQEYVPNDAITIIEDTQENICDSCIENYHECNECGNFFYRDYIEINGEIVCNHCLEDKYYTCDECGNYEKLTKNAPYPYCFACGTNCCECGDTNLKENMHIANNEYFCHDCYYEIVEHEICGN